MKKIFPIILVFISLAIVVSSCKKDEDEDVSTPSVSISSPVSGAFFTVFDTITVVVTVNSEKVITLLTVSIIDDKGIQVGGSISTNPGQANFTITDDLIINEASIAGGEYKVVAKANDGSRTGIASVMISIKAIPKRYRGLLVVSQQNNLKTIISLLDSVNNLNVVKNINYGYAASSLSSYWQQLLFSTPSPSTLYSYRLDNFDIEWQFVPPSPYPEIPVLYSTSYYLYAGVANGTFVELNALGAPNVVSHADLNRIPKKIFRFNDYILMDNAQRNEPKHVLTVSYASSGTLFSHREIDYEIVGFGAINNDEVVIFANQNGNALIKIYDVMNDKLNEGVMVPLGTFYDMVVINNNRFLISHDNGILLYEANLDQLSIYIPAISVKNLAYNTIDNVIFAAKDTVITLYDYNTGGIMDFVTSPYSIKDLHVFYNR